MPMNQDEPLSPNPTPPQPSSQVNIEHLFRDAESYDKASRLLETHVCFARQYELLLPSIVYAAFALELYLKCLLAIDNGSYPETHFLTTLFASLREDRKTRLRNKHNEFAQRDPLLQVAKHTDKRDIDLDALLESEKNAFAMMRYAFEGKQNPTFTLGGLRQFVREIITEMHPAFAKPIVWKHQ